MTNKLKKLLPILIPLLIILAFFLAYERTFEEKNFYEGLFSIFISLYILRSVIISGWLGVFPDYFNESPALWASFVIVVVVIVIIATYILKAGLGNKKE